MKAAYCALIALALGATAGVVAFAVVAIWTHGPDAGRWAGTAFLSGVVGLAAFCAAAFAEDQR